MIEMPDKISPDKVEKQTAVREIAIPNHYFNGFEIGTSMSDMSVLALLDGIPQARLSMSFTTAKTLALKLSNAIEAFESATKHDIMTIDQVKSGMDSLVKNNE